MGLTNLSDPFDVIIIIGGGATGAGVACDCSRKEFTHY